MHPNAELITRFYTCFQNKDGEGMAACYHPDVHFSDPVFTDLRGDRAAGMWRMFCATGTDLRITFSDVQAGDDEGSARWEAHYTFSGTGRKVHNRIAARFTFKDGKILRHQDAFDFYAWTRMALGPAGLLLGWTPLLQNKVRSMAGKTLEKYLRNR